MKFMGWILFVVGVIACIGYKQKVNKDFYYRKRQAQQRLEKKKEELDKREIIQKLKLEEIQETYDKFGDKANSFQKKNLHLVLR
ncbi:MAG: hypothetical protein U9O87_06960 [Verrucomicrobiota bacterium]|nr:hypothetical protein [Verrucomicrobiota bacterium]